MSQGDPEILNVLVVDDDDPMRRLLADIIARKGHQVVVAESAEKALEQLPFWSFQVAFIDQNLPGMDGLVLGEYLRNSFPDMILALVTGAEDPKLERRSRKLSIRYVAKPFQVSAIAEVLEECLARNHDKQRDAELEHDPLFHPSIGAYMDEVKDCYAMPGVPSRIADKLVQTLRRCLSDMRSQHRYVERDRVVALSGLLAAQVLGIDLPCGPNGVSLFDEYDQIMLAHGKATAFESPRPSSPDCHGETEK